MCKSERKAKAIIQRRAQRLLSIARGLEDPLLAQLLAMAVKAANDDEMRYLNRVAKRPTIEEERRTLH